MPQKSLRSTHLSGIVFTCVLHIRKFSTLVHFSLCSHYTNLSMTISNYADLEIRIIRRQESDTVELTLNNEQQFGPFPLDLNAFVFTTNASPAEQGQQLCDWLFSDKQLNIQWSEIRGRYPLRRIRLRIDADVPELHALPWELLREVREGHPALDLAASSRTPFSRYIAGAWQPGSPVFERPLKVLALIPSPENLAELGLPSFNEAKEWSILQEALSGIAVEVTQLSAPCTLSALQDELRKGYHVLHIVTHGVFQQDQSVIVMEDAEKQYVLVGENEFSEMLTRIPTGDQQSTSGQLRLVYLDSCETAMRDNRDAFRGFAPALVKAGVPAVIAMQELIEVGTAQAFASTFYRQLLIHGQVDLACNEARSALITAHLPGAAIPVLFMRLPDATLLGTRGRVSGRQDFWPFLIGNIEAEKCVPILGPGVLNGLLPSYEFIAQQLANEFGYPLPDVNNLARVAQFMQTRDPALLVEQFNKVTRQYIGRNFSQHLSDAEKKALRTATFPELVEKLDWSAQIQKTQENEIHHLLAQLEFPLYLTTNVDNFMAQALRSANRKSVRQLGIRWHAEANASTPEYAVLPYPSVAEPVVLHLNGFQGDPEQEQHMIFSEDDYLQQFARVTQQRDRIFPANVLGMLAKSSFLLIGFNVQDWEFRLIVQGLLPAIAQTSSSRKSHVGIQIDPATGASDDKVITYLAKFLERFNIEVYWGTPKQFANELHSFWQQRPPDDGDPFK